MPPLLDKPIRPGRVNGWVCRGVTCLEPIAELGTLTRILKENGMKRLDRLAAVAALAWPYLQRRLRAQARELPRSTPRFACHATDKKLVGPSYKGSATVARSTAAMAARKPSQPDKAQQRWRTGARGQVPDAAQSPHVPRRRHPRSLRADPRVFGRSKLTGDNGKRAAHARRPRCASTGNGGPRELGLEDAAHQWR